MVISLWWWYDYNIIVKIDHSLYLLLFLSLFNYKNISFFNKEMLSMFLFFSWDCDCPRFYHFFLFLLTPSACRFNLVLLSIDCRCLRQLNICSGNYFYYHARLAVEDGAFIAIVYKIVLCVFCYSVPIYLDSFFHFLHYYKT
jgi:hypothetical protein